MPNSGKTPNDIVRKITVFLLDSDRNVALVAFLCTLLPLFRMPGGFLAAILVGLVTLQKGYKSGLIVLAWVALPAVSLLFLHRFGVFDILLLRCVLVWTFAIVLRTYHSWRLVLELATLLGFIVIFGLHLLIPDIQTWWHTQITNYLKEISQVGTLKLPTDETQLLIKRLAPIATGIAGFLVLLGTWIQLLLARWWQSYFFNPGGLRKEFIQIRMGNGAAIIISLVMIAALLRFGVAIDVIPIVIMPFMVAGLSLMHLTLVQNKALLIPAILIYVGLFFLPVLVIVLLTIIGYLDSWFDFRRCIRSE